MKSFAIKTIYLALSALIFLVCFHTRITPHVLAADEPAPTPAVVEEFTDDESQPDAFTGACSDAAPVGAICHVAPDLAEPATTGQSTPLCHTVTDDSTDPPTEKEICLPVGAQVSHKYNIHYKPGPGYESAEMTKWSGWMQRSWGPVTTAAIQDITVNFTNPQYESDMGKTCYYDDQGNKVNTDISKTKYRIPVPWLNNLVQYPKNYTANWSTLELKDQNYEQATEYIKKAALRPCGFRVVSLEDQVTGVPSQGEVVFTFFDLIQSVLEETQGSIKSTAVTENSRRTPKSEQKAGYATTLEDQDLTYSPLSPEQQAALQKTPGFIDTFKVIDYRPDNPHTKVVDNPMVGSFDKLTTSTHLDHLTNAAYINLCRTVLPTALQTECEPKATPTPTTGGWNCNTSASASTPAGLSQDGGLTYANKIWGSCPNGTENAWTQCKNDVISRATKACVDPTFTLAIWIHESGASNYKCGDQFSGGVQIQDFGDTGVAAHDFSAQLDAFLKLPNAYAAVCPSKTLNDFVSMFRFGHCYSTLSSNDQTTVGTYINELTDIYASIAPGKSLPTWPGGSCSSGNVNI